MKKYSVFTIAAGLGAILIVTARRLRQIIRGDKTADVTLHGHDADGAPIITVNEARLHLENVWEK